MARNGVERVDEAEVEYCYLRRLTTLGHLLNAFLKMDHFSELGFKMQHTVRFML